MVEKDKRGFTVATGIALLALIGAFGAVVHGAEERQRQTVPSAGSTVARRTTKTVAPAVFDKVVPPLSKEQVEQLEQERQEGYRLYERRVKEFDEIISSTLKLDYELRRENVTAAFRGHIETEEKLSDVERRNAIEHFEEFLKKYPDDPPYTPDAMFRLAELYYDESYINYLDAQSVFTDALEQGETEDLRMPRREFGRTIALLRRLVRSYPTYRNVDGAFYVLGYCLNETAREEEARLAWLASVCGNKYVYDTTALAAQRALGRTAEQVRPAEDLITTADGEAKSRFRDPFAGCEPLSKKSRFYFESWWLIGNYHFDFDTTRYGVETSISAYKKLVEDPGHRFYDKGLYKLAWSYFKADMYPEAIEAFAKVVDFAEEHKEIAGTGMRPEAVQYLAVCFFTEDWDLDLIPDETSGIARVQNRKLLPQKRPWTREVYQRLGDIYYDNERNEQAIEVWRIFLKRWPLDVNTPFLQEKIALAYNKMRRFEDELDERRSLDKYGPGSRWWLANSDHPLEQAEVAQMSKDALLESAYYHHQNAQKLKQRGLATQDSVLLEMAVDAYESAADSYRKFIDNNPDNPDSYEINFYLADALFWAGRYEKARVEYAKVRDSNLDDKHRAEAAASVIYSLEKIVTRRVADGSLVIREEPPEVLGDPPSPMRIELPGVVGDLMFEREQFLAKAPEHKNAAIYKYQSAQNYYRYGHWQEAKQRYEALYDEYCTTDPVGIVAWKTLLNMATLKGDIDEKERLALVQRDRQCKVEGIDESDQGIPLDDLLGDVAMQRALSNFNDCVKNKDFEVCTEAGNRLVAAVEQAPEHPSADAALHNAALAYETAQRYETAMDIYGRIVEDYPGSQWVGKCLFKQAYAASRFFEYEKALDNYRILADEKRFQDSEYRVDAVYNSAFIMTNLESFKEAVPYWRRYADEVDDPLKQIEAAFNAAHMYFKARRWKQAIGAYEEFIDAHRYIPEAGPSVVRASHQVGRAHANRKKLRYVIRNWEKTINFYRDLVNEPGSMAAEYAAEAHFKEIEREMRRFERFEIKGSMRRIEESIAEGARQVQEFEARYREIQDYRRPVWSIAAEFRIGYAYEVYAKALLNIPPPPLDPEAQKLLKQLPKEDRELVMLEYEDKFRGAMAQYVSGAEEKAQAEYKVAIELARKGNISNEWTLLALERMNAYDPENYPRRHNGRVERMSRTVDVPAYAPEVP